jgi:predicted hotdog family 3-hydroxylacyl-ACP dehydratase
MNMSKPCYAIAEVVPHAGPMLLIDEILDYGSNGLTACVTIRDSSLFLTAENVVPAWVGIEYMAQTIAAWAGVHAKLRGDSVKIGYLLGTRHYLANKPGFALGDTLIITVSKQYHEGELAVFDCKISSEQISVSATLNVFQPFIENIR